MAVKTYSRKKDGAVQLSPHFRVREFACSGTDTVLIDEELIALLERLYAYLGCSKIIITSGYRSPAYDKKVGGSSLISVKTSSLPRKLKRLWLAKAFV